MNVPSNLKYSNDHEWCRMEGNAAYVGITDFAQSQLGDIVFVDVPTEGETVAAGEVFGTIEAVKTVSDAFLPGRDRRIQCSRRRRPFDRQQGSLRRGLARKGAGERSR